MKVDKLLKFMDFMMNVQESMEIKMFGFIALIDLVNF